ncbi:MAG: hypothetical protein CME13_23295 [Gemmatimonadetes bacterium]|nr:hypothetical protein [Gemmatimonadota bacterium]HCV23633.1 hypothetical protein [Candidatus Latescibacterota bacterium]|tara:strand:- start:422 stop:721 length:300 start_codon:yes stop_codon:yes gene_type:complete
MFNEFLTTTLQVVIALNVAGLIAYFCLGSRRRPTPTAVEAPGLASSADASLWTKLIQPCKKVVETRRPAVLLASGRAPSLDSALGQLRRVLDGYGASLR